MGGLEKNIYMGMSDPSFPPNMAVFDFYENKMSAKNFFSIFQLFLVSLDKPQLGESKYIFIWVGPTPPCHPSWRL